MAHSKKSDTRARLCVIGASGRTGALILSVLHEFPEFVLSSAVVSPNSKVLGTQTLIASVSFSSDMSVAIQDADVVIDFSTPASAISAAEMCVLNSRPLLVATTGFSAVQLEAVQEAAAHIPLCVASNTSVGVFALTQVALQAQLLLGPQFEIEIVELHHKHKKDAPSGTALSLATALTEERGTIVSGRAANSTTRIADEVSVESLRGGDVAGEHTVYFLGEGERLELTHRATDRRIFARGALRLALALMHRGIGMHTLTSLLTA